MKGALKYLKTGGLLEERTLPGGKPFTKTCLEFIGQLDREGDGEQEVCPLLLVCQDTGAVHTQVAYDYSTSALLVQWNHFVAEHGRPTKVVSDQGSQLTCAGNTDLLNWNQVEDREAEQGTTWEFDSAGYQWRNELAKSRMKAFKVRSSRCSPNAEWREADSEL